MVACARRAASTKICLTASRLLMASRSQSNNSRSRWRPRAFNPLTLLFPSGPSTALLLRRVLRHRFTTEKFPPRGEKLTAKPSSCDAQAQCMVRFLRLQEKNASRKHLERVERGRFSLAFIRRVAIVRKISPRAPHGSGARHDGRREGGTDDEEGHAGGGDRGSRGRRHDP